MPAKTQTTIKRDFIDVSLGLVEGYSFIHKFGENPDIDIGGFEDIWEGGGIYTFSTEAQPYYISSDNALDTQSVDVGLLTEDSDRNWNIEVVSVTLQGQTPVEIVTTSGDNPIRLFRMINRGTENLSGYVYVYEDDTVINGEPQDPSKIRGIINNGNNQTLMSIFTIPSSKIGFITSFFVSLSKKTVSSSNVRMFIRNFGQVFALKETILVNSAGSSVFTHKYDFPLIVEPKSDIIFCADSSVNDTGVGVSFNILLIDKEKIPDSAKLCCL